MQNLYATITVEITEGGDTYTYDVCISSKNGITITSPEDEHKKKQVLEFLACAYAASTAYIMPEQNRSNHELR